jgi:hypothetical protein
MNWIGFIYTLQPTHFTKCEKCVQEMARKCLEHVHIFSEIGNLYKKWDLLNHCNLLVNMYIKILEMCGKAVQTMIKTGDFGALGVLILLRKKGH